MPPSIQQLLQSAVQHHQSGRLPDAEKLYRQILSINPKQPDALHFLGVLAHQFGRNDAAVQLIQQAIAINPKTVEYHVNLGVAYKAMGDFNKAIDAYQTALQLDPNIPELHNNLGLALVDAGRSAEAITHYRRAIQLNSRYAPAWSNLGNALLNASAPSQYLEALQASQKAVQLDPRSASLHANLAVVLQNLNRLSEALDEIQRAIAIDPRQAESHYTLGSILYALGRPAEAVAALRQAIALRPDYAEAYGNLGGALHQIRKEDEALAAAEKAVALQPNSAKFHFNLGVILQALDRLTDAESAFRRATTLNPQYAEAHSNLAVSLQKQGRLDESIASFRAAIQLKPDLLIASDGLLFTLQYHPTISREEVFAEHRSYEQRLARPLRSPLPSGERARVRGETHDQERAPETRKLRIGYVSPDFRKHAIAYFIEPILVHHNRDQFEIYCYSSAPFSDAVTERLKSHGHTWRDIYPLTDERAAEQIRQDKIDILIDLAVHTNGNRLLVFARKPAPIQLTWLGYAATTGLSAIDYRITDAIVDPVGTTEPFHSERLLRLPHTQWAYRPPQDAPDVAPTPFLKNNFITFGSANILPKITAPLIEMWTRILQQVPNSHLRLKARSFADATTRDRFIQKFTSHGIDASRIDIELWGDMSDYLTFYSRTDIILDTFPFTGGTTTCHALWMGAPVVTLTGTTSVSRVAASVLTNIGADELIASTPDEYVSHAVNLASNPDRLAQLRASMRERMNASPLRDEAGFTQTLESALQQIWQKNLI